METPEPAQEIKATFLFVDLINSTGISGVQDPTSYNRMLTEYQALLFDVITDHVTRYRYAPRTSLSERGVDRRAGAEYEWEIAGDEGRVYLYSENPEYDVRSALQLAVKIKLAWLTSDFNAAAFEDKGLVFDVGTGVHAGKVIREVKAWRQLLSERVPRVDGFAVNIGKKVEGFSRGGRLFRIDVSGNVRAMVEQGRRFAVKFSSDQQQKLKDSAITLAVFEVVAFLDHEAFLFFPEHLKDRMLKRVFALVETGHLRRDLFWLYLAVMRYWLMDITGKPSSRVAADNVIRLGSAVINFATQLSAPEQTYIRSYLAAVNNMVGLAYVARGLESDTLFARKIFAATISRIDPQNIAARVHLARQYVDAGDYKAATKQCADVLMLDPGNPAAEEIIQKGARQAVRQNAGTVRGDA